MLLSDKFHDECGVVAIHAHPEAEKLAYLGLHAFNIAARSQPASSPPTVSVCASTSPWDWSPISSAKNVLSSMRGTLAIGHTRYSTAGDSALLNAQPIMVQSNKGTIAIAHNGNLVNAACDSRQAGRPRLNLPDQ